MQARKECHKRGLESSRVVHFLWKEGQPGQNNLTGMGRGMSVCCEFWITKAKQIQKQQNVFTY